MKETFLLHSQTTVLRAEQKVSRAGSLDPGETRNGEFEQMVTTSKITMSQSTNNNLMTNATSLAKTSTTTAAGIAMSTTTIDDDDDLDDDHDDDDVVAIETIRGINTSVDATYHSASQRAAFHLKHMGVSRKGGQKVDV